MKKKILINAVHPEEWRVAIVESGILVDFHIEASAREHLKGNIYKGVVVRVEPGLQAAFVEFGAKKHGFLPFREIRREYYIKKEVSGRPRIQDVISKGQELLVQVEKDERDTKGASLTTYMSLPGRYIVMMPGEDRVSISRKIEDDVKREKMRKIFESLKPPENSGFIIRTAGLDKSKTEIAADLKYLLKLWESIREKSEKLKAPSLVYREQDIAVRTVRDYLTSDVGEVLVDEENVYKNLKEFFKKFAPGQQRILKLYKEKKPLFSKYKIEEQVDKTHERYIKLPSRGYIVIDETEALTAIDVNSGRSHREKDMESTALKTNMEAADEIARQLRLRDIGGLIVIDFIDMKTRKHNAEVEKRLKDSLKHDKAHMDFTHISNLGLLEMSRERLRPALRETVSIKCPTCGGSGLVRSVETLALTVLRRIESASSDENAMSINCGLPVDVANYLLNQKRSEIIRIENEYGVKINISGMIGVLLGQFNIEVEKKEQAEAGKDALAFQMEGTEIKTD